jgi:branched-chain amino acid transport system ATP-binding protein
MLLDEPSLGLAPKVVEEIFAIIARINRDQGVAMLLVEQNAFAAFEICSHAYIMESGKIVVSGSVERLREDVDVQRFYLGYAQGQTEVASFRDVKHYKRRKRWLS